MSEQVLAGIDVTAYNIVFIDGLGNPGAVTSMIGRWKEISITMKNNWADRTSSDAHRPKKRRITQEFSGKCSTMVDTSGSVALQQFIAGPYVLLVFTESNSTKTVTVYACIDEAQMTVNAEMGSDDLSFSDGTGLANPITYA